MDAFKCYHYMQPINKQSIKIMISFFILPLYKGLIHYILKDYLPILFANNI